MANVAKYTKSSTGLLCQHYERKQNENGEYVKFGNQDIDLSKSHLNFNLAEHQKLNQVDYIKKRLSEVSCLNRKDVKVMCTWVVTLPKKFNKEDEKKFFENTYNFLENKYKKENVISAYVHVDENQPHLHFAFIPVTIGKDGKEKVSAKEVLSRGELKRFHPELKKHLEKELGYQVDILNGATANGNRTVAELKAEQETEKINEKIAKINSELYSKKEQIFRADKQLKNIENNLLSYKEIKKLDGKKTLGGGLKGVSFEEFEALQKTALKNNHLKQEIAELKQQLKAYVSVLEDYKSKLYQLEKSPKIKKLEIENYKLEHQLSLTNKKINDILKLLPEETQELINQNLERKPQKSLSLER